MKFFAHRLVYSFKKAIGLLSPLERLIQLPVFHKAHFTKAFSHGGHSTQSYERLEFLGDAIIEGIVSDYLFHEYPEANEGMLTQMRSKLVRRNVLNLLGYRIGLGQFIHSPHLDFAFLTDENKRIFGDSLEALVGAIYLNNGYKGARFFVETVLIKKYVALETLPEQTYNYKGELQELSRKHNFLTSYEAVKNGKKFTVTLYLNNKAVISKKANTLKKAEQRAAKHVLKHKKQLFASLLTNK